MYEPVPNQPDGRLLLSDLQRGFPDDPDDPQFALPSLICVENTQNRCGGVVLPTSYMREVRDFAAERTVPVHLDGARLFNAAVALGVPAAEITRYADSVQFCLSKGLGAPIGSILAGDGEFIRRAHRIRKMLGGGMRQAGVIAAAGLLALDNVDRLAEDHDNARRLAEGLAETDGIEADPEAVQTNIIYATIPDAQQKVEQWAEQGVLASALDIDSVRFVLHYQIDDEMLARAIGVLTA